MCAVTAFLLGFMNKKPRVIIIEEHLQCCLHLPAMQQRGPKTAMRCAILPPPRDIDNGTTSVRGHYVHATSRGTLEFWPLHKGIVKRSYLEVKRLVVQDKPGPSSGAGFRCCFTHRGRGSSNQVLVSKGIHFILTQGWPHPLDPVFTPCKLGSSGV